MRSTALVLTLLLAGSAPAQFAGVAAAAAAGRAGALAGSLGRGGVHAVPHGSPGGDTDWPTTLGILAGVVVVAVVVLAIRDRRRPPAPAPAAALPVSDEFVRVTGVPPGEAPEHIRQAWVGVVLPVHPTTPGLRSAVGLGVLTGEQANLTQGYFADTAQAVAALALVRPDAAGWWRANTPHLFAPGQCLVFPAEVCERV